MDRLGIVVVVICLVIAEAGIAYEWSSTYVSDVKRDMESTVLVNLSHINISSKSGILEFMMPETNATAIKMLGGPVMFIGIFNESDLLIKGEAPNYNNIWKIMVENSTAHDAELLKDISIGHNCTIWYIDYTGFTKKNGHVTLRPNVLVDVVEEN